MLSPTRFQGSDFARTLHVATVEENIGRDDLLLPEFWSNVAPRVRPWDRIEVRPDDGSFFAEYLVLSCGRVWVKVHELSYTDLSVKEVSLSEAEEQDGYKVRWMGPHKKFTVVRLSDKATMKDGMEKDEATQWMSEHIKTVG